MKRPVQWSRGALEDLKAQMSYIATENPPAARRVAEGIRATGVALGDMATGRPGRVTGTYEKSVAGLPMILAYAITGKPGGEVISILRVIHTSRDWPPEGWPK
ncbi:type II toxin-antitoxin system RelE/ParE family toxin [Mesorhizobium xinjiangense]|uniref:type II toxin-antitoxin system RelE/ParE family toxin n=1 Tax=Mesorhizobium xinjiangense TaxID=2678685 RepID=UPI0012EDE519|nr:type II toxin-antitoxin system RelE/ParE family toxin [Mesorhizobium xinjiangense]